MIDKTHGNLAQKEKLLGEYESALRTTQDITSHTIGLNGSKKNILYNLTWMHNKQKVHSYNSVEVNNMN